MKQTELYMKCIKILATDFQKIPTHDLQKLSTQTLELVFTNESFVKPSETLLLNFIFKDPSKYSLLKFVNLCKIDSTNLKIFLEHLKVNEIDNELFENIKQLLFFKQDFIQQLQAEITTLHKKIDSLNINHQNYITKIKEKYKK
jgi:hypothetical protein